MKFAAKDALTQLGVPGLVSILFPAVAGVIVSHYGLSNVFVGAKGKVAISYLLSSAGTAVLLALVLIKNGSLWDKAKVTKMLQEAVMGSNRKSTVENPNM